MRIRPVILVVALAAAACSAPTEPMLSCQDNPKCTADTHPSVPSELQPMAGAPRTATRR